MCRHVHRSGHRLALAIGIGLWLVMDVGLYGWLMGAGLWLGDGWGYRLVMGVGLWLGDGCWVMAW